jgi:hypothetical protein
MASSIVNSITMSRAKSLYGNLAHNNYYEVYFGGIKSTILDHLRKFSFKGEGLDINNWITRDAGLLCSEASLPSSSFATSEVKDNFLGVTQEFAHTRLFTDVDFTFYVDNNYNMLRFFEGWMDYISGNSEVPQTSGGGYYRRFAYPNDYKVDSMYISKFEKNAGASLNSKKLVYTFINAFPKAITSIPVSYGPADILKVSVTFNYDRYTVSRDSIAVTTVSSPPSSTNPLDTGLRQRPGNIGGFTGAGFEAFDDGRTA